MKCKVAIAVSLLLAVAVASAAQEKRQFTVEDLWKVKRVSGPALSPDGERLAIVLTCYSMEENSSTSNIWLIAAEGDEVRQMTSSGKDSSPAWSPDGKTIAFTSSRHDGPPQVYLLPVDGGEARKLTDIPTGASDPKWSPDGGRVYFKSRVWPDCADDECNKKRLDEQKESQVKAHVTEEAQYRSWDAWLDGRVSHIFATDAQTGAHRDLMTGSELDAGGWDVSPDGSEIAFGADSIHKLGLDHNYDLFIMPAGGGEPKNLTQANPGGDGGPVYSPDGKKIAFSMSTEKWAPDYDRVALYDRESGGISVLTEGFEYSASSLVWAPESDRVYFTAGVRGRSPVLSVQADGGDVSTVLEGNSMSSPQLSPCGKVLYFSRESFTKPPTIFRADMGDSGEERQLSRFNDELLSGIAWHSVEEHTFKGAGGDDVHMFLLKPPDFDGAKKWPLFQIIHGGPHGAWDDSFHFRWNAQLFGAPGYVTALVNFHGSSGYGQAFYDSIAGAEGGKPYDDIVAATDYLLGLGYIDPARLATGGGSYGGYLANWINGQTDRFACLIAHAGSFNHHGMWASDGPIGRKRRWGGFPWENLENTDRWSPNRFAASMKTPTLVIHGDLDYRVVVTQGLENYNTLKIIGVEARLLHYPDEGHWVLKPQNARLWWNEVHAWLDRFIGKGPSQ